MYRKLQFTAFAAACLLWPSQLVAGGPPWVCMPIDGVTADNAQACADLVGAKLGNSLWEQPEMSAAVGTAHDKHQRYLTFFIKQDVGLAEIEAALKGSDLSVPRDRLRLFGHVILEIDASKTPSKELIAALDSLDQVSIAESHEKDGVLFVTAQMPYPVVTNRPSPNAIGWEKFAKNDYSGAELSKAEPAISPQSLPSYDAFREVLAKHTAALKDIRWSTAHACRALGCVSEPQAETVIKTASK